MKRPKPRLDRDGVPIRNTDWTETDWSDLHYGMEAIKKRIAKRHAAVSMQKQKEADDEKRV